MELFQNQTEMDLLSKLRQLLLREPGGTDEELVVGPGGGPRGVVQRVEVDAEPGAGVAAAVAHARAQDQPGESSTFLN